MARFSIIQLTMLSESSEILMELISVYTSDLPSENHLKNSFQNRNTIKKKLALEGNSLFLP